MTTRPVPQILDLLMCSHQILFFRQPTLHCVSFKDLNFSPYCFYGPVDSNE